jgi:hypothetical protein
MTTSSTSDVLDRHLNSFAKYDLAGILADYSSDAVLFTPAGPLRGPAEIKPLFRPSFLSFQSRAPRSRSSTGRLRAITAIFSGRPKQGTIRMSSLPIHLLCGTGR